MAARQPTNRTVQSAYDSAERGCVSRSPQNHYTEETDYQAASHQGDANKLLQLM